MSSFDIPPSVSRELEPSDLCSLSSSETRLPHSGNRTAAMAMASGRMSNFASKVFGIDTRERDNLKPADLDKRAYEIIEPADIYLEQEPTVSEFLSHLRPNRESAVNYMRSLFPSSSWVRRYKAAWFFGDVIAGKNRS